MANRPQPTATRRRALLLLAAGLAGLAGCGGGGGGEPPPAMAGTLHSRTVASRHTGSAYPLFVYLPPGSDADRAGLPVVYLLDGELRFAAMVDAVEAAGVRVIVVGIGNDALRNRDYVPPNACTPGGGGQGAYLDFIRLELTPFVESTFGGHPQRRILLGHSHGGSFVFYALFAEPPQGRHFAAYLASDASVGCMQSTMEGWEAAYAEAHTQLPARLHVAIASNLANGPFVQRIEARRHAGLVVAARTYEGGHLGMIPRAFAEALAFALG